MLCIDLRASSVDKGLVLGREETGRYDHDVVRVMMTREMKLINHGSHVIVM